MQGISLKLLVSIDNDLSVILRLYVLTQLFRQIGCDTRPIFKWSTAGLNSEFFVSYIGCLMKANELRQLYLPIAGRMVGFSFFVLWHINVRGLFNAKANLVEQQWYYLTNNRL